MPTPGNSIREFHAPKSRTGNPKPLKQGPERRTAGRPRGNPGPEPKDGEYREEKNRPAAPATRSGRRGGAASGTQPSSRAQTRRGTAEVRKHRCTEAGRRFRGGLAEPQPAGICRLGPAQLGPSEGAPCTCAATPQATTANASTAAARSSSKARGTAPGRSRTGEAGLPRQA